jgi:hypothetical protein
MVEKKATKIGDILLNLDYGMYLFKITRKNPKNWRFYVKPIYAIGPALGSENNWFGAGSVFHTHSYNLRLSDKDKIIKAIFGEKDDRKT